MNTSKDGAAITIAIAAEPVPSNSVFPPILGFPDAILLLTAFLAAT